jgi:molybdopterin/thiamine biosynthesis adenylyltransferase
MILRLTRAAYAVVLSLLERTVEQRLEQHAYFMGIRLLDEFVVLHVVSVGQPRATAVMIEPDYGASGVALAPLFARGLELLGDMHTHLSLPDLSGVDESTLLGLSADFAGYLVMVATPGNPPILRAATAVDGRIVHHEVVISDADVLLPSRVREHQILQVGLGSLGSLVALQVARLGIGVHTLVDNDRLSHDNLRRHLLTASDIGKYKVRGMAREVRHRTTAIVRTHTLHLGATNHDRVRQLMRASTIVLNTSGDPRVAFELSAAAATERRVCFHAGVYPRGRGGLVYRQDVDGPCYRCLMPLREAPVSEQQDALDTLQRQYGYTEDELSAHVGMWSQINLVAAVATRVLTSYLQGVMLPNLHVIDDKNLTIQSVNLQPNPDCTCKGAKP